MRRQKILGKKYTKEELEEIKKKYQETPFEKGDRTAVILAAMLVFLPVVLLVLGVFAFSIWFFFMR